MNKWKAIVSIIIVFLLGAVAGALVTHKIYKQQIENAIKGEPKMTRKCIVRRLNHELSLDATQLEQLRTIVQETHAEKKNTCKQIRPQIEEILVRSQDKVRPILRPDQLVKYEKNNRRAQEKTRERGE